MKKVRVIFSPEAEEVYKYLNKQAPTSKNERMILNAVNNKIELIKANFHYGYPVAKKLIPQEYKSKYGVTNLFRVELPNSLKNQRFFGHRKAKLFSCLENALYPSRWRNRNRDNFFYSGHYRS